MNEAEKNDLEARLKRVAPLMNRLSKESFPIPDRVRARFNEVLDRKFPVAKELSEKEMEALLLKLIAEEPNDGFSLTSELEKARFKLKGGAEGAIYGILNRLESKGMLEGRWRESSATMTKTYHLTDRGTKAVKRETASSGELQSWANLVLGRSET